MEKAIYFFDFHKPLQINTNVRRSLTLYYVRTLEKAFQSISSGGCRFSKDLLHPWKKIIHFLVEVSKVSESTRNVFKMILLDQEMNFKKNQKKSDPKKNRSEIFEKIYFQFFH